MAFITLTHWTGTEMNDEMISAARDTFVPLIKGVGADRVEMVRTGDLTMTVITHYPSETVAKAAAEKIAEIRAKATSEMPMKMDSAQSGEVFAHA